MLFSTELQTILNEKLTTVTVLQFHTVPDLQSGCSAFQGPSASDRRDEFSRQSEVAGHVWRRSTPCHCEFVLQCRITACHCHANILLAACSKIMKLH